jgi:hypothetical protein
MLRRIGRDSTGAHTGVGFSLDIGSRIRGQIVCGIGQQIFQVRSWHFWIATSQREKERRAPPRLALRPNASAVAMDDPLNGSQADASTFEILLVMETLEHSEKFIRILRVKADAIIADKECSDAVGLAGADADNRPFAFACEFGCVRKQVEEDNFEKAGITVDVGKSRCAIRFFVPMLRRACRRSRGERWSRAEP